MALEAKLSQVVPVADTPYTMILGRVQLFHIRADLLKENGLADSLKLNPLSRLGGDDYGILGKVLTLPRPIVDTNK